MHITLASLFILTSRMVATQPAEFGHTFSPAGEQNHMSAVTAPVRLAYVTMENQQFASGSGLDGSGKAS